MNGFLRQVVVSRRDDGIRQWKRWLREDLSSRPYVWLRPDFVPPPPFLVVQDPHSQSSRIIVEPHLVDAEFCKAWMPYFCRSGHPDVSPEQFLDFIGHFLPQETCLDLPRITGRDLQEVARGLRVQMEIDTIWSWYVQSYAGRLAVVLYVGVLVGFIAMIINQIIYRTSTTNISSDYFVRKELNAALRIKKLLQKFWWDSMKYIRFVTEFKGNWTTETPSKEGNLSCDVACWLSKAAITEGQENASKSSTTEVCKSTSGDENSLRKDERLNQKKIFRFPGKQRTSSSAS